MEIEKQNNIRQRCIYNFFLILASRLYVLTQYVIEEEIRDKVILYSYLYKFPRDPKKLSHIFEFRNIYILDGVEAP